MAAAVVGDSLFAHLFHGVLCSCFSAASMTISMGEHHRVCYRREGGAEKYRDGAEVYRGDALCREKTIEAMLELRLPTGLLPLEDLVEVGYNRDHGFMWLTQRKKKEHMFKKIKQLVSYATEVTAFVEERKLKKITGVKARELLLWLTVVDVFIGDPSSGKITFKTGTGLSDTFPVSAFELEQ